MKKGIIPGELKFSDFSDTTIPYMYHCHILMHEGDGMMGQFIVGAVNAAVKELPTDEVITIYPNPATDILNIKEKQFGAGEITISDAFGRVVCNSSIADHLTIEVSSWKRGLYTLTVIDDQRAIHENFILR